MSAAESSRTSRRRPAMVNPKPASCKACPTALPMPLLPPVMMAFLLSVTGSSFCPSSFARDFRHHASHAANHVRQGLRRMNAQFLQAGAYVDCLFALDVLIQPSAQKDRRPHTSLSQLREQLPAEAEGHSVVGTDRDDIGGGLGGGLCHVRYRQAGAEIYFS